MRQRSREYLLLACGTAVSLTFGMHAISPALPAVQEAFGLDDFAIGWVTSAYVLPGVLFAVPLGIVSDLLGRRWVFASSALFYGIMGFAQSLAVSFGWLLVWRGLQGLAFAALMPLTVTIIGDGFSGLSQVRAQATRQVSMAAAALVVPIVGAQLALMAWSHPFVAQGLVILPGLAALHVLDKGRPNSRPSRGYPRTAFASLKTPGYPSVLVLGFVRFLARFSILGFLPIHLTRNLGSTLTEVGIVIGVATGLGFVSALLTARLSGRFEPSRLVLVALLAIGSALVGFAAASSVFIALLVAAAYASGDGVVAVLQSAYAARGAPESVRAVVVAVNGTTRNAGKFVGPLLVGAVASFAGFSVALGALGILVAAAAMSLRPGLSRLDSVLRVAEMRVQV